MLKRLLTRVRNIILTKFLIKIIRAETYFKYIYKYNYWEDSDSRSGPGSNFQYTEQARIHLPIIFTKYQITSIFDAPCGDFFWMNLVIKDSKLTYLGGDLVEDIIQDNRFKYSNVNNAKFVSFDITKSTYPDADLWICRDVHFHLSNDEILQSLYQFCRSKIKFVLLTSHKTTGTSRFTNTNIQTGGFRLLDMTKPPFSLPQKPLYRFDDYIEPHPEREMLLYNRLQIIAALQNARIDIWSKS